MARTGKIARLPFAVREQLNERLLDNEDGGTLLTWLNGSRKLAGAEKITPQNLSEWRAGGFAEWLRQREKIARTKALSEYCFNLAKAGGGSMDLPAAIAGGQLMEVLEEFNPASLKTLLADKPETWIEVLGVLAGLQGAKTASRTADMKEVALKQTDRKLALAEKQFQVKTCELFLKWYRNEKADEIAANKNLKPAVAVEQLRTLMFGEVQNG